MVSVVDCVSLSCKKNASLLHRHMVVPGREGLFTTLYNNLHIINQQKSTLDQLVQDLTSLRLYSKKATAPRDQNTAAATRAG